MMRGQTMNRSLGKALVVAALLVFCGLATAEPEKKIALTFEELPYMKPLGYWRPREVSNTILRTLEAEKITAAGFVVQVKVEDDPPTYIILSDWAGRGHIIGNQTWGDADLNEISAEEFLEHAVDGQKYLKKISRLEKVDFRYLRFPQLHEGNEERKRKDVLKALDRGNYRIAHVSVKTSDALFNRPFIENETDSEKIAQLRQLYLAHIAKTLDYAESQSQKVFGRNIAHVLQLHDGIATATFLPDLIAALRQRGYTFVSMPEALEDPAYQTEENYIGPLGLSFIDRVAATRGLPFDEESGAALTPRELDQALRR